MLLLSDEEDGHQWESDYGHGGANWKVYAEADILYDQIGHEQEAYAHCAGYEIVFSDIRAFADYAAEVWHSEGDEADRTADGYGAGDEEHDCKKKEGLLEVGEFDLTVEMPCQSFCSP